MFHKKVEHTKDLLSDTCPINSFVGHTIDPWINQLGRCLKIYATIQMLRSSPCDALKQRYPIWKQLIPIPLPSSHSKLNQVYMASLFSMVVADTLRPEIAINLPTHHVWHFNPLCTITNSFLFKQAPFHGWWCLSTVLQINIRCDYVCKICISWQHSIHMKAVLPLDKRLAWVSQCIRKAWPWLLSSPGHQQPW